MLCLLNYYSNFEPEKSIKTYSFKTDLKKLLTKCFSFFTARYQVLQRRQLSWKGKWPNNGVIPNNSLTSGSNIIEIFRENYNNWPLVCDHFYHEQFNLSVEDCEDLKEIREATITSQMPHNWNLASFNIIWIFSTFLSHIVGTFYVLHSLTWAIKW